MIPEAINVANKHDRYQFTAYVGHAFSDMGLLGEYENAINIIIKELKATKTRIDVVAHPVLYMMRHSLELGYKGNFEYFKNYSDRASINMGHNLEKLHLELKAHFDLMKVKLNFDKILIEEFEKYYNETSLLINQLGPTEVSSFRYTRNTKGQRIFQGTETKNIGEIKALYDKAVTMLVHTSDLVAPYTDYADLVKKLPDFQGGLGTVQMTFPSFQLDFVVSRLNEQYEKIDRLSWKDKVAGQMLVVVTIDDNCYLTPVKR